MPRNRITTQFEAEDRGASQVINRISGGMREFAGLAFGPVGVIAGATAIAAGVGRITSAYVGSATAINRMTRSTGANAESVSRLLYAWRSLNLEGDDLDSVMVELNNRMAEATRGNADVAGAFDQIGISVDRLKGLSADEALFEIVDGLQAIERHQDRVNIVDRIFGGDDGRRILPLLQEGSAGIRALGDEAERLGFVLDSESAQAAESFQRNIQVMQRAAEGGGQRIAQGLVNFIGPAVQSISERLGLLPPEIDLQGQAVEQALLNRLANALAAGTAFGDALADPVTARMLELVREAGGTVNSINQIFAQADARREALQRLQQLGERDEIQRGFGQRGINESYTAFLTRTGREPEAAQGLSYTPVADFTYANVRGRVQPPPGESVPTEHFGLLDYSEVDRRIEAVLLRDRQHNEYQRGQRLLEEQGIINPIVGFNYLTRHSGEYRRASHEVLAGIPGTEEHRFVTENEQLNELRAIRLAIAGPQGVEGLDRTILENVGDLFSNAAIFAQFIANTRYGHNRYVQDNLITGTPRRDEYFRAINQPYDLNAYEAELQRASALRAAGAFTDRPRDDFGYYDVINQRQAGILEALGVRPADAGDVPTVDLAPSLRGPSGGIRIDGESLLEASQNTPMAVRIVGYTDVGNTQSADFSFNAAGQLRNQQFENWIDALSILGIT